MEKFESHAVKVSSACHVIRSAAERLKQLRQANLGAVNAKNGHDLEHTMDIDIQVDPELQLEVEETSVQGEAMVQNLKLINRDLQHEERELRNALTDLKVSVGQVDLGLQNLKYQRKYLLNEIARCHDFETYYQDVTLVSIDEFRVSAPQHLSETTDDHQLMLNRLQFELDERKRFDLEKRKLLAIKTQLAKANKSQKAHITKIEKQLEDYVAASAPIQELLLSNSTTKPQLSSSSATHGHSSSDPINASVPGANHTTPTSPFKSQSSLEAAPMRVATTDLMKRNDLAQLLPEPLYVLYRHATAFSNTFGDEVRAEIHDLRSAPTVVKVDNGGKNFSDETVPLSTKAKTGEDDDAGGQHNRRGSTAKAEQIYERAPFDVVIKIKKDATTTSNTIMHLRFGYLVRLGVIVVKVEGAPGILKLDSTQILHELFPRDFGEVCPNPEAAFLGLDAFGALASHDENSGEPGSDIVLNIQEAGGYAYRWAQEICGLEYLGPHSQGWGVANGANGSRVGRRAFLSQVVRLIRSRRRAWKALERQMEDFERGVISQPRPIAAPTTTFQDAENIHTFFAALRDGLSKSNLTIRGWHVVETQEVRHALLYRIYFDHKTVKDRRVPASANIAQTSNALVEGTVEIYLAYPDQVPQWELKPGPAFPEEPAENKVPSRDAADSNHLSTSNPNISSKDVSPGLLEDENVEGARDEAMEDVAMDEKDTRTTTSTVRVSLLEQLRTLQVSVNHDVAGMLQNAGPYEHNLLISTQVARIQLGLDTIHEACSQQ